MSGAGKGSEREGEEGGREIGEGVHCKNREKDGETSGRGKSGFEGSSGERGEEETGLWGEGELKREDPLSSSF